VVIGKEDVTFGDIISRSNTFKPHSGCYMISFSISPYLPLPLLHSIKSHYLGNFFFKFNFVAVRGSDNLPPTSLFYSFMS